MARIAIFISQPLSQQAQTPNGRLRIALPSQASRLIVENEACNERYVFRHVGRVAFDVATLRRPAYQSLICV
jgi:hypothetical protein